LEQTSLYYISALKKRSGLAVMLHPQKMSPSVILEIVSSFIVDRYKIPLVYAQFYLRRSLPNASVNTTTINDPSPVVVAKKSSVIVGTI